MNNYSLLKFLKPGLNTQIHDGGRVGHQSLGVPVGGFMDRRSATRANWLVGNDLDGPLLEITFAGPTILFEHACQIAITGANMSPRINDRATRTDCTLSIEPGDILSFGRLHAGCRAYLAVGGEWKVVAWLGSCSAMGNLSPLLTPDSIFHKGSYLKVLTGVQSVKRVIPRNRRIIWKNPFEVRVTKGPELEMFPPKFISKFFSSWHEITPQSNRMGYRLKYTDEGDLQLPEMISSGCIPGTIQITHAGQPIILMADAQTTGGYWRIANIISPDLSIVAQAKPGDRVKFQLVDLDEAAKVRQICQYEDTFLLGQE